MSLDISDILPVRTCADLAPIRAELKHTPEDFVVEEIPAYLPSGQGQWTFAWIEKRDMTTPAALERLCGVLGSPAQQATAAGMKDRRAVTRQWVSLADVTPEQVRGVTIPGLTVLAADRHDNRLKPGHLRGNRFTMRLRSVETPGDGPSAIERVQAVLERLGRQGCANWFGKQRFGNAGDTHLEGRDLLRGEGRSRGRTKRWKRRLVVSAYQAALFNRYLRERLARGWLTSALDGDVLKRTDSGGLFVCEEPAVDQVRVDSFEVSPTGPVFGYKMRRAMRDADALEAEVLQAEGVQLDDFRRVGKLGTGTRRPVRFPVDGAEVEVDGDDLVLKVALPKGSYATVLLAELGDLREVRGEDRS